MTIQKQLITGVILLVLGIGFFALQFLGGIGQGAVLFLIGGMFIAGYVFGGSYGLLIPGGILLGIALGTVGDRAGLSFVGIEAIGLGLGFASIYIIDRGCHGKTHWWPLIPAAALTVSGLVTGSVTAAQLWTVGWPLILVVGGVLMLARAYQDAISSAI